MLSLAHPGPMPPYLARDDAGPALARLALDRLLEIRVGGEFVTGLPACDALRTGPPHPGGEEDDPQHPLLRLSIQVVCQAAALTGADPLAVTARLYCYHRQPHRRAGPLLDRRWHPVPEAPTTDGWYGWQRRTWRHDGTDQPLR